MDNNDKRETRIGYLEKSARSNLYGLGVFASLGELQHDAIMACDTARILKLCEEHLKQLLDFQVMSFSLIGDDSSFELVRVNPESEKSDLQIEIDEQIENGNFAWAVSQNRPVVVKSKRYGKSLILHALATKSKVRGMFAGVLAREDKDIQETVLYPLSIILHNTSYAIEAASLHKLISDQNKNLEEIVLKRTQTLEEQSHELKQEIAYRRLAEESLVVAKEEAERAARAKSDFIANISHEFRTPLNAILGYCEILQYETKNFNRPDIIEDLKSIEVSGRHLLVLFNDILDFSKIQVGKMDVNLEDFNVLSLVEDVMSTIRPLARKNRNTISVTSQGNVKTIFSDSGRVRQILLNLLSNACKFTEDGSVSLKVSCETINQTDWLTFSVSDTGIGISQKMITQLFKEFSQAENSTARKYGGTGLGLAISRRLCQMLGGDISVKSELGKGTVFIAKLPADATELAKGSTGSANDAFPSEETTPLEEASEFQKPSFSTSQQEDAALPSGKNDETLLAINNDSAECDLIRRFMEMEGFRVYTALNASEGLRLAREVQPDVIILDELMPEMEGWTLLSQLKEDPLLAPTPVVMLSVEDEKEKAIELGASDLLTKPIEWDPFLEVIKRQMKSGPTLSAILVVEDDATNRGALCRVLRREGLEVLEAVDGNVAMDMLVAKTPGLIILDLILPDLSGFDVLSEISKNDDWKHIPIIVITAKELTNEELKRLKKEVDCIFQKGDYSRNDLLNEIYALMAKQSYPA
jgi:signal transduction histidine kinase/DNA-binding response OmpR family regulator